MAALGGGVVEQHQVAAKTLWEDVGRCSGAEGGEQDGMAESGFDLSASETASTLPLSCSRKTLRELRATNKINSY